ncbi:MAG: type II secretion system protein [Alphaproteobacteria bacterium]
MRESGLSLLEVVFAFAILMAVAPFVYRQMSSQTESIQDIAVAKQIDYLKQASVNYIAIQAQEWPVPYAENLFDRTLLAQMKDYGLSDDFRHFPQLIKKYQLIISKKDKKSENEEEEVEIEESETEEIKGYLVFFLQRTISSVRGMKIIEHLGVDAGYAEDDIVYGNYAGWEAVLEGVDHAIVIKISISKSKDQDIELLARMPQVGAPDANTMETDFYFNHKNKIDNVQEVVTDKIETDHLITNKVKVKDKDDVDSILKIGTGHFYNKLRVGKKEDDDEIPVFGEFNCSDHVILKGNLDFDKISGGSSSLTLSPTYESIVNVAKKFEAQYIELQLKRENDDEEDEGVNPFANGVPSEFQTEILKVNFLKISGVLTIKNQTEIKAPDPFQEGHSGGVKRNSVYITLSADETLPELLCGLITPIGNGICK